MPRPVNVTKSLSVRRRNAGMNMLETNRHWQSFIDPESLKMFSIDAMRDIRAGIRSAKSITVLYYGVSGW